jgi:hypothetical protein
MGPDHSPEQLSDVRIVVDPESLTRSEGGQIAGVVSVEIGSVAFPDSNWSDSVVVVLGWWLSAITSLRSGDGSRAELLFMDGPFRIDLVAGGRGILFVSLVGRNCLQLSAVTDAWTLEESLLKAARAVDRACFEREWRSPDVLRLHESIRTLVQLRRTGLH